ncbi:MAG: hypothetical protein VX000_10545, partial [Myxococcota bacterium]|nr:hypothetical protein [Myxococcota bacterium]
MQEQDSARAADQEGPRIPCVARFDRARPRGQRDNGGPRPEAGAAVSGRLPSMDVGTLAVDAR